jgi:streptothricin acetyltransferase
MPPITIEIRDEAPTALADYARVPIAYTVREVLAVEVAEQGLDGIRLIAQPVAVPYTKDYDAIPGNHPTQWPARFDLSCWGILAAWSGGARMGGVAVACDSPGLTGRTDSAVIWDLRVAPAARGRGVGAALFSAAEQWAAARGGRWLQAETQNVNSAACRFYARQGCTLAAIDRFAYPTLPDETQLVWRKGIGGGAA